VSKDVTTRNSGTAVTPHHTAAMLAVGVVGAIVAFWALSSIIGIIAFIIKLAVIFGLIGGAFWLVSKFKRR
jgi:uncharacterized membrane protein